MSNNMSGWRIVLLDNLKSKEELTAISLDGPSGLGAGSVTDFDLYIDIGGLMILYAPQPYRWEEEELHRLRKDGHSQLFYETEYKDKVDVYKKLCLTSEIDFEKPPEERILDVIQLTSEFNRILYAHEFTPASLDKAQQISSSLLSCVQEMPSCVRALNKLSNHHEYTFQHSGRVAAYTIAMALKMSLNAEHELENIALGCLLHDIGKSGIDQNILNKEGPLDKREWQDVRQHPEIGHKMVSDAKLELVPTEIILHHHEREDGGGYPHRLSSCELLTEVKIAAFADVFDALTSQRPYQKTRTRFEALDFIRFNLMDLIYQDAYKAMVELLRPD